MSLNNKQKSLCQLTTIRTLPQIKDKEKGKTARK